MISFPLRFGGLPLTLFCATTLAACGQDFIANGDESKAGAETSAGAAGTGGGGAGSGGAAGSGGSGASGAAGGAGTGGANSSGAGGGAGTSGAAGSGSTGPCPQERGPSMIDTGRYCIDSTEVTRGHYQEFMDAVGDDVVDLRPTECEGDPGISPEKGRPTDNLDFPIDFVDWCDAKTFCVWSEKRLCGRIGGGANAWSTYDDEDMSQWYAACSADGVLEFPYGNDYIPDACNGLEYKEGILGSLLPVKTLQDTCEGGFPGLYDMSGNAREWTDNCRTTDNYCGALGGSFGIASGQNGSKCSSRSQFEWWTRQLGLGFRCCADYD